MAIKLPSPEGDKPLVSKARRDFLFGKLAGRLPANLMGQQPESAFRFNLLGSPFASSQMQAAGTMGVGGMPQFNIFGTDQFGNQLYQMPSSEPREYFGPFKKQVEDKRAGSFEDLFGKDSRLDNRSKDRIFRAQADGKITREQAESLASRIQDYYDRNAQRDIVLDIIGGNSPVAQSAPPALRQMRGTGSVMGGDSFSPTVTFSYV